MTDFDRRTVEEFRANGGRVGGVLADTPLILIHHIGARSRIERVTPLAYWPLSHDTFAIVASNGGSLAHPGWYHNLKANSRVTVEIGTETFTVEAQEILGLPRAQLWQTLLAGSADLRAFDSRTGRSIPLLLLKRLTS